jgi:hypothetical protein
VYVLPKLKYGVSSKQKKMIDEPFPIPEKAPVGTFACSRWMLHRHWQTDLWRVSTCAKDVMHSAPPAAATHTARRASIATSDEHFMTAPAIMMPLITTHNYQI